MHSSMIAIECTYVRTYIAMYKLGRNRDFYLWQRDSHMYIAQVNVYHSKPDVH